MKTIFKKFIVRIQNPKVITALVSGALLTLVNVGIVNTTISHQIMGGVNTVLTLLVGLGVFSNPDSHVVAAKPTVVTQPEAPKQPQA